VILLTGLEDMSGEQTAAILRISTRAARARLACAKENLCAILAVQRLAQAA
jgi:DNA-directed RNA polymerase specialized sigma24 family protein